MKTKTYVKLINSFLILVNSFIKELDCGSGQLVGMASNF